MFKTDKIVFFNNYHNGDIHGSRGLVNNVINTYKNSVVYEYIHNRGPHHLEDIPVKYVLGDVPRTGLIYKTDNIVLINTHFGAKYNGKQFCLNGCNSKSSMEMLNKIYKELEIQKSVTNEWELVPEIDYSFYDVNSIKTFFKKNTKPSILVCNGNVWSGQSENFSFCEIVKKLSTKYKQYNFIVTSDMDENDNLFNTNSIIKSKKESDLVEISFLSTYCNIVIGRSSGPFTFAQTKITLDDSNKTMISFNNKKEDAFFTEMGKTKKIWSNNYNKNNVEKIIEDSIMLLE